MKTKHRQMIIGAIVAFCLAGCFNEEKGVQGQAFVSLGDNYHGQALVDFPIYCYGPEFESKVAALKADLNDEYERIEALNDALRKGYAEEKEAYFESAKVWIGNSIRRFAEEIEEEIASLDSNIPERVAEAAKSKESKVETILNEIEELEAQQRASTELAQVLKPFVDEQRQLQDSA